MTSHESGYPMFKHAHVEEPHMWKVRDSPAQPQHPPLTFA